MLESLAIARRRRIHLLSVLEVALEHNKLFSARGVAQLFFIVIRCELLAHFALNSKLTLAINQEALAHGAFASLPRHFCLVPSLIENG